MVRTRFGGAVWARWIVGGIFGEAIRIVELEVAKYFIGRNVMQALVMLANCFEDGVRADNIGLDERPRVTQRIVIVTLGGKVYDYVGLADELVHELGIGYIAFDESDAIER